MVNNYHPFFILNWKFSQYFRLLTAGNVAPMDPAGDALSGAMDQVADQGAGGGAPDMGVPADAGDAAPMDDPNAPDPNAPPDEVDPIV